MIVGGHPKGKTTKTMRTPKAMAMASICRVGLTEVTDVPNLSDLPVFNKSGDRDEPGRGPGKDPKCSINKLIERFYKGEEMKRREGVIDVQAAVLAL